VAGFTFIPQTGSFSSAVAELAPFITGHRLVLQERSGLGV